MPRWEKNIRRNAINHMKNDYDNYNLFSLRMGLMSSGSIFSKMVFVKFNKIKAKDVVKYLNDNNIKSEKKAMRYINTLTDSFKCRICNKDIPCKVMEIGQLVCLECVKNEKTKYENKRKSLIGKTIMNVEFKRDEFLKLFLNNGTILKIEYTGEYCDNEDCYEIINGEENI